MMMIHRMMLKTHLLLTTHVRFVHSILFRGSLQTTERPGVEGSGRKNGLAA